MEPRCSAASRVPFGGSAALDAASALWRPGTYRRLHIMTADELKTLTDRLVNSLQTTLLLATRLRADLTRSARDAEELMASASKASEALVEFRRGPES